MKLLLLPLLLVGASAGWYGLGGTSADTPAECPPDGCRMTVECTDRDTCIVTCYDENDVIVCQEEIACDEPCEKACETPCEAPAKASCDKPCAPGACSR
jgi:hypothetical protein